MVSEAYIQHIGKGPFLHQIDPWSEKGRYFHQLHGEIISHLMAQVRLPLLSMGYLAGRETSLQIAENSQPDLYIERSAAQAPPPQNWQYSSAAEAVKAAPGVFLERLHPELDALSIKEQETGRLVTVVEIISPSNKADFALIDEYEGRRGRLQRQGVHVVEVDLTRSVKRLVPDKLLEMYPYHVAIHLYDQPPRFIGIEFGESLHRVALPLRGEVIPVELQIAYEHAYRQTSLALHIHLETGYAENALPFPTLIPESQRQPILQVAQDWQTELKRLQAAPQ